MRETTNIAANPFDNMMDRDDLKRQIEQATTEAANHLKTMDAVHGYFMSSKHDFANDEEKFAKLEEAVKAYKDARKELKDLMDIYNGSK